MKLYRIEHKKTLEGMWTTRINGALVLEFLSDKRLLNMPMPKDDIFRTGGKIWKTAVHSKQHIFDWFSTQDITEMLNLGFVMKEIYCENVIIQPYQILFDDSNRIQELDISDSFLAGTF